MLKQAYEFRIDGEPLHVSRYGNGHINDTYLLTDITAREYILQRINKKVFQDPEALMNNVAAVIEHLRKASPENSADLKLVQAFNGNYWVQDAEGEYWRLFEFIDDSICLEKADNPEIFRESAVAFGTFQRLLSDFDASLLVETIPHFHDTPRRYQAFHKALREDVCGRAKDVRDEIDFFLARESYASTLMDLLAAGELPLRVTHNDTKLNNVLFDKREGKALCVIDLDTVMPGLVANDFGDSIRFGASTAAEDEPDLRRVHFSLPLYEAYTEGFLSACEGSLTPCEETHLADGAKMMTLECGLRFLTDHLQGDTYFRVHRENQNLDRCRTQRRLVEEMERDWDAMRRILETEAKKYRTVR